MPKKIRVAILYGGRSGEHEIFLQSAASVIRNLDPTKFEIIPISSSRFPSTLHKIPDSCVKNPWSSSFKSDAEKSFPDKPSVNHLPGQLGLESQQVF